MPRTELVVGPTVVEMLGDPSSWQPAEAFEEPSGDELWEQPQLDLGELSTDGG